MMTSLFRQSEARRSRRRLFFATVLVVVVFLIDALSGGKLRLVLRSAAAPIFQSLSNVGTAISQSGFFATRGSLARQNALLTQELSDAKLQAAEYAALKNENEQLRAVLKLVDKDVGITAPIISSVRSSPYGTFLIGAGSADGVKPQDLVVAAADQAQGVVIGRVRDVGKRSSLVAELFAPGGSIEGSLAGASVIIEGKGGGNARTQAPRALKVVVGDLVSAPSLGARPIGIVGKVESSAASSYQDVFIGLPVNLTALTYVYVIPQ